MNASGSIWSSDLISSVAQNSQLDNLLEKGGFELEDLLDQEDIIQECKAMNSTLVDHLCEPASILKMVRYLISTDTSILPEVEEESRDLDLEKRLDLYTFKISEIFACEIMVMLDALLNHEHAMDTLFSVLHFNPLPLKTAGFFRKVVGVLIQRKYEDLQEYLVKHPEHISALVDNVSYTSIMEVLIMLGWDDGFYQHSNDVQWLVDMKFIPQIIEKLDAQCSEDTHCNAAYTLVDIISKSPPSQESPLMNHLQSPLLLRKLLDHVFQGSHSAFTYGVRILIALIQRTVQFESEFMEPDVEWELSPTIQAIVDRLEQVLPMLQFSPEKQMKTTFEVARQPLGEVRLRAAEFICNLIQFDHMEVQQKISELELIPKLLDLFFQFPWHNVLHNLIESAIHIIFAAEEGKCQIFRHSLFVDGKLLERIIKVHQNASHAQLTNGGFRWGNIASANRIALILGERMEDDDELRNFVGENEEWNIFVDGALREEHERLSTVLGGQRPPSSFVESEDDVIDSFSFANASTDPTGGFAEGLGSEIQDDDLWHEYTEDIKWHPQNPMRNFEIEEAEQNVLELETQEEDNPVITI